MSAALAAYPSTKEKRPWSDRGSLWARLDRGSIALTAIVLVAAALRFNDITGPSLWYDEIASLTFARQPLSRLWSDWMLRETNPPLYYSLLHVWIRLFGESELALRTPGALAGTAVVWLVYRVAAEVGLRRPGLLAALFTAVSSLQVHSSQEARAYIFAEMAALVAVLGLIRIARAIPVSAPGCQLPTGLALWSGGTIAALYLHTTMVALPLIGAAVFALLWLSETERSWRTALLFIAVNVLCLVAWSWWLWITLQQMNMPRPNYAWMVQPSPLIALVIVTLTLMPRAPQAFLLLPVVLFIPALIASTTLAGRGRIIISGFFVGVPALLYGLGFVSPVLTARTLLWAQFSAFIALAAGVLLPRARMLRIGLPALLIAAALADLTASFDRREREPWRAIVNQLSQHLGPEDALLFADDSLGLILDRFCEPARCRFARIRVVAESDGTERWAEGLWQGRKIAPKEVEALVRSAGNIWAIRRAFSTVALHLRPVADEEPSRALDIGSMPDSIQITPWRPKEQF